MGWWTALGLAVTAEIRGKDVVVVVAGCRFRLAWALHKHLFYDTLRMARCWFKELYRLSEHAFGAWQLLRLNKHNNDQKPKYCFITVCTEQNLTNYQPKPLIEPDIVLNARVDPQAHTCFVDAQKDTPSSTCFSHQSLHAPRACDDCVQQLTSN